MLFKRIDLPKGLRKHSALFIWVVLSLGVLSIALYFLIQYIDPENSKSEIPRWEDGISITYPDNGEFSAFLMENRGGTIYLSSFLEMSLSSEESYKIVNLIGYMEGLTHQRSGDVGGIDSLQEDFSLSVPLDALAAGEFLRFKLLGERELSVSSGGTGVVQFPIDGYFKVTVLADSAPPVVFELTEIPIRVTVSADGR